MPHTRKSCFTLPMTPAQIAMYSQRHLPGYTNDRCDACGELAPKTIDKMNHYKSHLPEGSAGWKIFRPGYECYLCAKTHKKKDAPISYLAYHHIPSLQYPCPECPETYSNRDNLSVHRTKWHDYVPNAPKPAEASDLGAQAGVGGFEETPYATSEASLPGLFDGTAPGLGRASSSTTPLMTPAHTCRDSQTRRPRQDDSIDLADISHTLTFTPANATDVAASYAVNLAASYAAILANIYRFGDADVYRWGAADVYPFGDADIYSSGVADLDCLSDADVYRFGDAGMY
ncbi:hypothetical protein EV121DRAFT_272263 [Schizophyllum commune]